MRDKSKEHFYLSQKKKFEKMFGNIKYTSLFLYQFFKRHLSRKAEGFGPMKPWQPIQS